MRSDNNNFEPGMLTFFNLVFLFFSISKEKKRNCCLRIFAKNNFLYDIFLSKEKLRLASMNKKIFTKEDIFNRLTFYICALNPDLNENLMESENIFDLGLDEFDLTEIIMRLEEEFMIFLEAPIIPNNPTLKNVVDHIFKSYTKIGNFNFEKSPII